MVTIEGIASREAAEAMRGRYLETDARQLPAGSYYWHELVGLIVETDGGELLVPAIHDVVRLIDVNGRRMVVRYAAEEVR